MGCMSNVSEKWATEDLRLTMELLWGMDNMRAFAKMSSLDWELHKTTHCAPFTSPGPHSFPK